MGIFANRNLKLSATLWTVTPDGYGGDVFGIPVLVRCRWDDIQEIFRNSLSGAEQVSKAVVTLDTDASTGDYLALGDYTTLNNPTLLSTAHKIQHFERLTDLRNVDVLRRAML